MIKIIDFSKCIESGKIYGDGSTTNKGIIYNDKYYILKYQDKKSVLNQYDHTKLTYFNSIYSEYIACHIGKEIGLNIQETLLGIDDEIPCVACKDFCGVGESIYNFKTVFNNVNKKKNLNFEIDKFMHNLEIINSQEIISKDEIKQYFLDMFVFDAFIGNFDRHGKNWGLIKNDITKTYRIAPIYDCGSSMHPKTPSKIINEYSKSINYEFLERTKNIRSYFKDDEGKKINYYNFLIEKEFNHDKDIAKAILRIAPKIVEINESGYIENLINDLNGLIMEERIKVITSELSYKIENMFKPLMKIAEKVLEKEQNKSFRIKDDDELERW